MQQADFVEPERCRYRDQVLEESRAFGRKKQRGRDEPKHSLSSSSIALLRSVAVPEGRDQKDGADRASQVLRAVTAGGVYFRIGMALE